MQDQHLSTHYKTKGEGQIETTCAMIDIQLEIA